MKVVEMRNYLLNSDDGYGTKLQRVLDATLTNKFDTDIVTALRDSAKGGCSVSLKLCVEDMFKVLDPKQERDDYTMLVGMYNVEEIEYDSYKTKVDYKLSSYALSEQLVRAEERLGNLYDLYLFLKDIRFIYDNKRKV
jgi:hypothetical protein